MPDLIGPGALSPGSRQADGLRELQSRRIAGLRKQHSGPRDQNSGEWDGFTGLRDCGTASTLAIGVLQRQPELNRGPWGLGSWNTRSLAREQNSDPESAPPVLLCSVPSLGMRRCALIASYQCYIKHSGKPTQQNKPV